MSKQLVVKCPICKSLVKRDNDFFPFCSDRCKTNDLGKWASGGYSIPDTSENPYGYDDNEDKVIH